MIKINVHIKKLKPSATLAINQEVKLLRENGKEIFHFGFGQSPFSIHETIIQSLKDNAFRSSYLPTIGLESLRKQISKFLNDHQNIKVQWEQIFIGPGSKELLYQTILILDGTYLIPKGSWVSYLPQIQSRNGYYVILETLLKNDFKLTPDVLEEYCSQNKTEQKILILNSPNNPTGAIYSRKELQNLAKVCRVHDVIVISDEIYSQVNFKDHFSPSISTYYPERTMVFGGLSKVFSAGGYRLGFMCLPKGLQKLKSVYRSMFSETFSAVSSPIQYAAIEAFKMKDEVFKYINDCTSILKEISCYIHNELSRINIECTKPEGAFYLIIGFNNFKSQINKLEVFTSEDLSKYLLIKFHVALLPGSDFYFKEDDLFLRLAFVDFNGKEVYHAFNRIKKIDENFIDQYCSNIFKGIQQIKSFVDNLN